MNRILHRTGLMMTIIIWFTVNVAAQEVVLKGSTHRYSISPVSKGSNYFYTWSVSGGTTSFFGNDSISKPILWDGAPGLYSISMFPTDNRSGCKGNIHYLQVLVRDFSIRWQDTSTMVCSLSGNQYLDFPAEIDFTKNSGTWTLDYQVDNSTPVQTTIQSSTSETLHIPGIINLSNTPSERHKIRFLKIKDSAEHQFIFDGTELDAVHHILLVMVNPTPHVDLGSDTTICAPFQLLLDAGNSGLLYQWSTGETDQTIWVNEGDGKIWVKVSSYNNCSASDTINISPCKPLNYLLIPNVFTPNGDGVNDVWQIGGMQYFPKANVKIFDRWGRMIFNSEPGYPKPWNGERDGKPLPMDAYFYIIDLKDGAEPHRGSVTLVP
jgi:gliding motility-associated-like protein